MFLQQTDNRLHFNILLPQKEFHCYFDEIFEAYQLLSPQHSVTIIQLTTIAIDFKVISGIVKASYKETLII